MHLKSQEDPLKMHRSASNETILEIQNLINEESVALASKLGNISV